VGFVGGTGGSTRLRTECLPPIAGDRLRAISQNPSLFSPKSLSQQS
jgi:hypothetical protein